MSGDAHLHSAARVLRDMLAAQYPSHSWHCEVIDRTDERIATAERAIASAGYSLRYVEYGEDADTPGLLGQIRGATSHERRDVKIATKPHASRAELADTLEHELRHVLDPSWDCGNRDVLGRGGRQ